MKTTQTFAFIGLVIVALSCNSGEKYEKNQAAAIADSVASNYISSSAAINNINDTARKFIRTADLKFKVKNVIHTTYDIEDITNRHGGFVTYTNLTSNVIDVNTTQISADSTLETTYYQVSNTITLRVPNTKLDTTLKEIAKNIDYLDFRIIKADDVALQILSNNLAQKRSAKNGERLTNAIDNRGKKLTETTAAEALLTSKQAEADNAQISNASLKDQINFSTIHLSIYQRQTIKRDLIANDKNIHAYEPSFGKKLWESLIYGWKMLEDFIVFLTKFWGLFIFVVTAYWVYKLLKKYLHQLFK